MSAPVAAPPPPNAPPPPADADAPPPTAFAPGTHEVDTSGPGWLASLLAGTPSRLSAMSALTVLAVLAFGIVGSLAVSARASALADARTDAEQLVRLQAIRTNLVQADAAAANVYLAGGLEDPAQRADYVTSVDAATADLAQAAQAGDATDADDLATVNQVVARYAGLIETARANNRQQFPVGAAYLREAGDVVRDEALPVLDAVSEAAASRVLGDYAASDRAALALLAMALLTLAVLVGGQVWLARQVRRVFNLPLVASTLVVLATLVAGLVTMGWAQGRAEDVRQRSYAATAALASARAKAYDAKSDESLTLILQGSGAGDARWKALDGEVAEQLAVATGAGTSSLADELAAWREVHQQIRELDDGNDWPGAVKLATGVEAGSSNAAFRVFADASQRELDVEIDRTRSGLSSTYVPLRILQWLVLGAGLIAVAAAWLGYARRLAEYR